MRSLLNDVDYNDEIDRWRWERWDEQKKPFRAKHFGTAIKVEDGKRLTWRTLLCYLFKWRLSSWWTQNETLFSWLAQTCLKIKHVFFSFFLFFTSQGITTLNAFFSLALPAPFQYSSCSTYSFLFSINRLTLFSASSNIFFVLVAYTQCILFLFIHLHSIS